jgi:hypothetical protein
MPVYKYRRIEDMPEAWAMKDGRPLGPRIRALLSLSAIAGPLNVPKGVTKYHSIEEAAADRERLEQDRVNRIRAARKRK